MSKIEWTELTWNPIVGCSMVSPGCTHCYAMRMAARLERMGVRHYEGMTQPSKVGPVWTGRTARAPDNVLRAPMQRRRPTMYFVNSMGDLFDETIGDPSIDRVFAVMAACPQHTFQILTKRAARMREYFAPGERGAIVSAELARMTGRFDVRRPQWPLPNVWLGVSAERQAEADQRIPDLLATPAAIRFVSAEPLLGPIDFSFVGNAERADGAHRYNALTGHALPYAGGGVWATNHATPCAKLDWIIVGGESGPNARPMQPQWVRDIRDQCCGADDSLHLNGLPDVPFFFKQWGAYAPASMVLPGDHTDEDADVMCHVGKRRASRLLDGREHNDMPRVTA